MKPIRTGKPEFDRKQALSEAKRLYVDTGIEKNITEAFRMYMEKTGEKFPVMITKYSNYNMFPHVLRPLCPECGDPMFLDLLNTNNRNMVGRDESGELLKTFWACKRCEYIGDFTTLTPQQWRDKLEKERAEK